MKQRIEPRKQTEKGRDDDDDNFAIDIIYTKEQGSERDDGEMMGR